MLWLLLAVVTLPLAFPHLAYAWAGDLDKSFGNEGIVLTSFYENNHFLADALLQPDGKILATGSTFGDGARLMAIARHQSDGTLDETFGEDGKVTTHLPSEEAYIEALALQSDGKILAVGGHGEDLYAPDQVKGLVVRYLPDGALDPTFGTNGIVFTDFGDSYNLLRVVAVQADGKIVVAGNTGESETRKMVIARYLSNGMPDSSFAQSGYTTFTLSEQPYSSARSLLVLGDGRILVGGSVLLRYLEDGTLDPTFGMAGSVRHGAFDLVGLEDGRFLALHSAWRTENGSGSFRLTRYLPDGTLDQSFGNNGVAVTSFAGYPKANAASAALQADGKVLVVGSVDEEGPYPNWILSPSAVLARFNSNGTLDLSFGTNGQIVSKLQSSYVYLEKVLVQSPDKALVFGYRDGGRSDPLTRFLMARYELQSLLNEHQYLPIVTTP